MTFFLRGALIMIAMTSAIAAYSQNNSKAARKYTDKALEYFKAEDYETALTYFLKSDSLDGNDQDVSYLISLSFFRSDQKLKALPFLLKAKAGGIKEPELELYLGEAYHLSHKFDKAIEHLTLYRSTLRSSEKETVKEVNDLIQNCKNGIELVKTPVEVKIKNLGNVINSAFPDYMPALSADESLLIFTSRRDNSTGGLKINNLYFEDIYISTKKDDKWSTPEKLGNGINTPSHDACVGISPDGQQIFIYKDGGEYFGDLFVSTLSGKTWSIPKSLGPNINTRSWEPCATITADQNVLFFVSNKKGGIGGTDIYMSKRQPNGEFGPATILSTEINTSKDEFSPFIHPDGKTLYFSSKGHNSMGGYDIFSCTINTETGQVISKPVNLGYPINTADDEVYFSWSADNRRAYFSSERSGGVGEKDLYVLERPKAEASLVMLKGTIKGCDNKKPVTASIIVTDIATGKEIGKYSSNSSTGKYIVILPAGKNYGITVEAPGYVFYSKNIDIPSLDHYKEIDDEICMEGLKKGTVFVLRNVFFDVNKATLRQESESELERVHEILTSNPSIKMLISGHTDSDGNDEYNLKLSENRAHAVKDYLINKGVSAERLSYKGYGETKPVAPNDSPDNKQLNRRTEIEIVE
ncbi:OmpA family protein [Sporocytophaga myxococcoides]|nr:OmpA family protein [Sporocytophaga myxococcoides]